MNLKMFILLSSLVYFAKSAVATTKKTTKSLITKKTTNSLVTKKFSTTNTNLISPSRVTKCYNGTTDYSPNGNSSTVRLISCSTFCYATKVEVYGEYTRVHRGCHQATNSEKVLYCQGYFYAAYVSGVMDYNCCETEMCNTDEFVNKYLSNSNCEENKSVTKSMKLVYRTRNPSLPSVQKCYYCMFCTDVKKAKVVDCFTQFPGISSFACQYYYAYMKNGTKVWNADCVDTEDMVFIAYKKVATKLVSCQSDLCNNGATLNSMENYTLCKSGYYY